jgi:hypothetical protein
MEALAELSRDVGLEDEDEDDGEVPARIVALFSISLSLLKCCFCLRDSGFVTRVCAKVCNEDVGFSATLLSAHAGEIAACDFIPSVANVF